MRQELCSLRGGVGGPGATRCHRVDGGASVLGHVIVGHGAGDRGRGLPDENGALSTRRDDELLVRGDSDL